MANQYSVNFKDWLGWEGGGTANVIVTKNDTAVVGWNFKILLTPNLTIDSMWSVDTFRKNEDGYYEGIIKPETWNSNLGVQNLGFSVTGSNITQASVLDVMVNEVKAEILFDGVEPDAGLSVGNLSAIANGKNIVATLSDIIDTENVITRIQYLLYTEAEVFISMNENLVDSPTIGNTTFTELEDGRYYLKAVTYYLDETSTEVILGKQPISNIVTIGTTSSSVDYSIVEAGEGIPVWPRQIFAPFSDACRDNINSKYDIVNESKDSTDLAFYNLGFIVAKSPTDPTPCWGNPFIAANKGGSDGIMQDIQRIRSMGGDVIISFGGLNGTYINEATDDVNRIKEEYKNFIKGWKVTRVDFDMEHGHGGGVANQNNHLALKMLQDELKIENYPLELWFTLPVLPTGLVAEGIATLDDAISKGVEIHGVNIMAMCYGGAFSGDMGQLGIDAMIALKGQLEQLYIKYNISKTEEELWRMIGVCPENGINDTGAVNTFYLDDCDAITDFSVVKSVGMIAMWSSNRDMANDGTIPSSADSTGLAQEKNDFTKKFQRYNTTMNTVVLNKGADCGEVNGVLVWHPSRAYTVSKTKVYHLGKYYENSYWVDAWSLSPDQNEAWIQVPAK